MSKIKVILKHLILFKVIYIFFGQENKHRINADTSEGVVSTQQLFSEAKVYVYESN